jgi:hypothetical protein
LQIADVMMCGCADWGFQIALVSGEGVSRITRDCGLRIEDVMMCGCEDWGFQIALVSGEGVSRITRDCRLRIEDVMMCGCEDWGFQIADCGLRISDLSSVSSSSLRFGFQIESQITDYRSHQQINKSRSA